MNSAHDSMASHWEEDSNQERLCNDVIPLPFAESQREGNHRSFAVCRRAKPSRNRIALQLPENRRTPFADRRILRVLADQRRIIPAALALCAVGRFYLDLQVPGAIAGNSMLQLYLRNNEQVS